MDSTHPKRIGIIGTGFIATGAFRLIESSKAYSVSSILTRRPFEALKDLPQEKLTHSIDQLIEQSDLVFEATGDAVYATDVIEKALKANLPVVTLNSAFHVTTGSHFANKGYLSEADGDQPGCFARLKQEAELMGFTPWAYINIKGYYHPDPPHEQMAFWAKKQGLRIPSVTSYTDGSKLQIEQALTANGLGATILQEGLVGGSYDDLKKTGAFFSQARELNQAVSDYIVAPSLPKGVYLLMDSEVANLYKTYPFSSHLTEDKNAFIFLRPHFFCHLEILKTIQDAFEGRPPLLNNSANPRIGIAGFLKRDIAKGESFEQAIGSSAVSGRTIHLNQHPNHVPLCLMKNVRFTRNLQAGEMVTFDDIELPHSRALEIRLAQQSTLLTKNAAVIKTPAEALQEINR